ncbi:MAG: glutamate--cysteine ligase, partial [Cyanobacteria bacterium]|nr:glutamate--cysteine ligase [Cyanobacteriota bacterium]
MHYNIPHLQTALTGRLEKLERQLLEQQTEIEAWFRQAWQDTPPPFYGSVDLRNAGYKIAPVDTNLFPAGFNNLSPELLPLSIQAVQATIERLCPKTCNILLIPESHTRNLFYLENLAVLRSIIVKAGFKVRIGSLIADLKEPQIIALPSGAQIILEPLHRKAKRVLIDGYDPDIILLNNDLSDGIPEILNDVEQIIMPSTKLGWATRLKSSHFQYLENVSVEFAQAFGFDPWVFSPLFRHCGEINFMTREGEDCLVRHAHTLLEAIKIKYREHHIEDVPFLVIKA